MRAPRFCLSEGFPFFGFKRTLLLVLISWFCVVRGFAAPAPDLQLAGVLSPSPVSVGELLTVQLTVTNGGTAPASGVTFVDTISSNATFFSVTLSQGSFTQSNGTVTCSLGSLNAAATATVKVVLTPGSYGILTNSASVSENETDLNPADNTLVQTNLVVPLTFYPGPNLKVARSWHTATLLADGRVLIAGGSPGWGGGQLASAEIYDPATKTFTLTGNMHGARSSHVAALLNDGTVLVASGNSSTLGAELFNPTNGTFTSVSNLNSGHVNGTATTMQDGRVLVEGADYSGAAEIYVPAIHGFTSISSTLGAGSERPAFLLGDGKVLLPGGTIGSDPARSSAEYYDPGLNQFIALPHMNQPRYYNGGVQLLDGRVLIVGGLSSPNTAEWYDTNSQSFVAVTNLMRNSHQICTANRLPGGKVLVAGFSQQPDLYDPANNSFSRTPAMLAGRLYCTATTLKDGTVLITGGQLATDQGGLALATTEIYDPARTKPPPAVSVADASVLEGNAGITGLVFNLTLSSAMGVPVSVDFATSDGTATAGSDYVATNGTVIFPPGVTNQSVTVGAIGDRSYEPAETFSITLSNPTNAAIDAASATGTILNDNPIPTVTVASAAVIKPNVQPTNYVINVSLSSASYQTVWVNYATGDGTAVAGTDYAATNGLLTFDPYVTNQTVTVSVMGNTAYESNKVFYVSLSNPTNTVVTTPAAETIVSLNGTPGYLDHFTFSPIASPQDAKVPFAASVTACDAANNLVTNFDGFVALTGSVSNTPGYWFDFEEGNFSQWTPLNLGNSPGPYEIVPFDVPGLGHTSLAFTIAANSGAADGITRPVTLQAGVTYNISADIASMNEGGGVNVDPGTAHLFVNGQQIGAFNFGVFGQIGSGQIFRTNVAALFAAPTNGDYQLSVRFDRGWAESSVWNFADNVRVSVPPLAPLWLAYFTNGVWTGNLTVGTSATNLVLHVDDLNGDTGNSAPFNVANFADLALSTSFAPNPPRVGANLIYTLLLTNAGPGIGAGIVVTNLLPPNETFLAATASLGSYSFSNGVVRWAITTLPPNQVATLVITTEPFLPGTVTNLAAMTSVNLDPNLTNNVSPTIFTVKPPLLYVSGPTVVERSYTTTNAIFNIFIGGPSAQTIQVDYATADGTAKAGLNYVAQSGHLTFTPPVTNLAVAVTVSNDMLHEPPETFALNLLNPTNAELANGGTANATILNTDPAQGLDHFDFSTISSPQQGSVPFAVTITARDTNDALVTAYSSTLWLTATDALGHPVPVSPNAVSLASGQWTGNLTVPSWAFGGVRLMVMDSDGLSSQSGAFDVNPPTVYLINLAANDLAYSPTSQLLYVSNTNGTLTPINPATGSIGTPVSIPNLSGRLCASDGGQYIFAALNGSTNHICQFDVNLQSVVNAWPLDGNYVDDMSPVLGSPAAVAVSRYVANRSPRFAGVAIYDNGVARPNIAGGFLGANVIEPSRSPGTIYGYDNESSPAGTQVMHVDASGISVVGGWGGLQGFGVDIACRAGLIFATSGQIYSPSRSLQIGTFNNTPVSDDAISGRYYFASGGAVTAYDPNTLLPVGTTALPGVSGAAGSFLRWGTNGFAFRVNNTQIALVRTPLIATAPAADLQLSAALPASVSPSNSLAYTLIVSNTGPNPAQNVVLTQTLPANSGFVSAVPSAGTTSVASGGLVCSLQSIPAGGRATVKVRLQTMTPGLLAAVASVTSDSVDPDLTNNVLQFEVPVVQPLAHDTVTELTLPTTDLVWDKVSSRLFASAPNSDWMLGNQLIVLNPLTGNYDPLVPTAQDPGKLAVADNGQYLYSGINSDSSIQRVVLDSRTADLKFPTGYGNVAGMAVLPGTPQSIAVTAHTTFVVFDNGVPRPNVAGPDEYNFDYYLAATATNTLVYEGLPDGLRSIGLDASGASIVNGLGLIRTYDDQIFFDAGLLYTTGGEVIDPVAGMVITNLPYSGLVCPDSSAGKIFYLTTSGSTGTLHSVTVSNFVETGAVTINNLSGTPTSLITWGTDGLAFRTTGNQVFLIRTIFADDRNNDGLPDSWQLQYFGSLTAPGSGPNDDPDHDGLSNLQEYLTGGNPLVPDSLRFLTGQRSADGNFTMSFVAVPGQNYVLSASSNLTDWLPIWNFTATNNPNVFEDTTSTNFGRRFYRIGPQ